jgi:polyketide biosynthesis enoyl-CoA hydratase PksI
MSASPVVHLLKSAPGVVQVTMMDREHKNTFSTRLTEGLFDAFEQLRRDESCRVIVLTGYDSYFCTGGTQETLLKLQAGAGKFTDTNLYRLPLDCEIPVIAAMQGHGIGGGFVLGLFADGIVLGRESIYAANFMKYGFTPGMGATCVMPAKLGTVLASEMLLSARTYRGAELEQRGTSCAVVPRAQVLQYAHELAREMAAKPRASLVMLKGHLVAGLRAQLPAFIEQEVAMHAATFHKPETRERIEQLFGR